MPGRLITTQTAFDELCDHLAESGIVAFDTEFVSESYYRPRLCLLQFATKERKAVVDPFEIKSLDRWWDLFSDDETTIVAHGAREEVRSACILPRHRHANWSMSKLQKDCSAVAFRFLIKHSCNVS